MAIESGEYVSDSLEQIIDTMLANAKEYMDEDLSDSQESVVRGFYAPVAIQLLDIQNDIGVVLEATQIDNANGMALDLLAALVGVSRTQAKESTGTATFSRETASNTVSYTIPSGTSVQTQSVDPIRFRTSESATLETGQTSVEVPIKATEAGAASNVGPNTLTVMTNPPTGIESVTNYSQTQGGSNQENDAELRERAKTELAEGSRATKNALLRSVGGLPGVESVSIFPNGDEYNLGTRPGFELVVQGGNADNISQEIVDTKAAGDVTYGGNFGTKVTANGELINGQLQSESFSRPTDVTIYVEATVNTTDEYAGEDAVIDSVINYIGGMATSGNLISGQISVGDDVLYGEIEYAVRDVTGVYDVDNLFIGTSASPNGESNISIAEFELATSDGLSGDIVIS